jgi:hypothetical protein
MCGIQRLAVAFTLRHQPNCSPGPHDSRWRQFCMNTCNVHQTSECFPWIIELKYNLRLVQIFSSFENTINHYVDVIDQQSVLLYGNLLRGPIANSIFLNIFNYCFQLCAVKFQFLSVFSLNLYNLNVSDYYWLFPVKMLNSESSLLIIYIIFRYTDDGALKHLPVSSRT